MIILILITIVVRLVFSTLPSFEYDESAYRAWSERLVELGPSKFYSSEVFTNNPLGGLYMFWVVGLVKTTFLPELSFSSKNYDFLLKLPTNIADIITGFIIYLIIKNRLNEKWATLSYLMYVLNPALIFNSSIWGQYDGFATLFLILAVYFILIKKAPELSQIAFATALAIKPQAIAFAPIFLFWILLTLKPLSWIKCFLMFLLTLLVIYLPFFPSNPIWGLIYVNQNSANLFNCTTCFAFNFWGMFGNWQNDLQKFLGITLFSWGVILFLFSLFLIFFSKIFYRKFKIPYFYLSAATSMLAFFTLLTRMHERYLFTFFPFLLITSIMLKSKVLIGFYFFMSGLHLLNLLLPYAYYNKLSSAFTDNLVANFSIFSTISMISFLFLIIYNLKSENA